MRQEMRLLKRLYYRLIKKSPASMKMVEYWKFKDMVEAKITKSKDGSTIMKLDGEKYPIQGFPRGYLLFGKLSKLKHEIKNQVFNESWRKLEEGKSDAEVIQDIKKTLFGSIGIEADKLRYDFLPEKSMSPAVREIHRAWTKVSPQTALLRDYLCLILQEDDAYKFRVQWLVTWFGWFVKLNPIKHFAYALDMLEHGEVVSDMKERARLLKRILLLVLKDKNIKEQFEALFKEIDWKKVKLTEGDKYHFRGKYFKTDLDVLDY